MKLYVADASFLIAVLKARLEAYFNLVQPLVVTDLVLEEIKQEEQAVRFAGIPHRVEVVEDVIRIMELADEYRGKLSVQDASCIVCALECAERGFSPVVLAGDGIVRKACSDKKIPVHGILWFFDLLKERSLLAPAELCEKLLVLVKEGERLPQKEVKTRIKSWCL